MKTKQQIDAWIRGQIQQQLEFIPTGIVQMARECPEMRRTVAERISRRTCMMIKQIDKELIKIFSE